METLRKPSSIDARGTGNFINVTNWNNISCAIQLVCSASEKQITLLLGYESIVELIEQLKIIKEMI